MLSLSSVLLAAAAAISPAGSPIAAGLPARDFAVHPVGHPAAGHPIDVQIAVGRSQYSVRAGEATRDAWVQVPIPIPYRGQTPMAIDVMSNPLEKVGRLSIVAEGANRYLRIDMRPLAAGEEVILHTKTFVLLRREKLPAGENIALPSGSDFPADVRKYLEPAPGIDVADARVQKIAHTFSHRDLKSAVDELFDYLSKNVKSGTGPQGAIDVLERGSATSAGNANLAAAVLNAARIPTRLLSCMLISETQPEYFIVEAWTPKLGWSKIETTMKTFPLDDSKHLVLRFVEPSSARSKENVPICPPIGHGLDAELAAPSAEHPWPFVEVLETQQVPEDEVEAIEAAERKAFEALIEKPAPWSRVILVPKTKPPAALKARGKHLLELCESRLDK
jgi:transglutaminase-like putative cysteine protease